MTNHKRAKALRRSKQKQKEIKEHRDSLRSKEIFAQEKPPTETSVPSKPKNPPSDEETVKEPVPVGAGEEVK